MTRAALRRRARRLGDLQPEGEHILDASPFDALSAAGD